MAVNIALICARQRGINMKNLNVIFRIEPCGDVMAVFPSIPADYHGSMLCYAHIGQHGGCSESYYRKTKPAAPNQYASLLVELRGIYENEHYGDPVKLVVRNRRTSKDNAAFIAETRHIANA